MFRGQQIFLVLSSIAQLEYRALIFNGQYWSSFISGSLEHNRAVRFSTERPDPYGLSWK